MLKMNTPAPELSIFAWINTQAPLTLAELKGRVVVIHAFQMLCPGCVSHGLPQASAIHAAFPPSELAVIGIHTVFEHHAVMNANALRAFVHEYKIAFPIGIDTPDAVNGIPITMQSYGMRGTPSLIVLDRLGMVRLHHFGRLDDLRLGALIGQLLVESAVPKEQKIEAIQELRSGENCNTESCQIT
ncbi:redoxin domain-containing protein [Undibacterium sp. Ren11W]|uniref:redoxin domain-containing protein n=1 Tax=Undibacterium sp. Ren11W TaxID=3413045 RepID=UPI003BF1F3FE